MLRLIVRRLARRLGPQGWWPAESPYEMMVGAILTQATRWRNVEQAIARLKQRGWLTPQRLLASRLTHLQQAIRPAGYFRQKAARLRTFSAWYVTRYQGRVGRMARVPWPTLRKELLALRGIGPETADAILLYAVRQPVFVVDAYTVRIFRRHHLLTSGPVAKWPPEIAERFRGLSPGHAAHVTGRSGRRTVVGTRAQYEQVQRWVMGHLPQDTMMYQESHALLVAVGKRFCHRRAPDCAHCPLGDMPHDPTA
jgi:endonuclease-3 related protein